ncbi:MAG: hypothetical protein IK096_05080, partial [Lachnospiraceae bacterium]|nr:hypothetical protein [Lachnospiraceae bacterium]
VKAVPKVTLAEPERKVKNINRAHHPHKSTQHAAVRAREDRYEEEEEVLRERVPSRSASQQAARQAAARSARPRTANTSGRMPSRTSAGASRSSAAARSASVAARPASAAARPASATARPAPAAARPSSAAVPTDDTIPDRVLRVSGSVGTNETNPSGNGGHPG